MDGAPIPESKMENVTVVLGTGQLMPAAEDAVYGHKAGESFRFDFTYPAEFRVPELSGKTAQFAITLHTVEQSSLYRLGTGCLCQDTGFDTWMPEGEHPRKEAPLPRGQRRPNCRSRPAGHGRCQPDGGAG